MAFVDVGSDLDFAFFGGLEGGFGASRVECAKPANGAFVVDLSRPLIDARAAGIERTTDLQRHELEPSLAVSAGPSDPAPSVRF